MKKQVLPYDMHFGLFADLYELTMAYGYWKSDRAEREAVFHLFFRSQPYGGGFSIAAGLEPAVEALKRFRFGPGDLAYLETLQGSDGSSLFESAFLEFLGDFRFHCDLDAVPEGTVVFPHEPLLRVQGPLLQAQMVETLLLNIINFQTLIATKAARVCEAAGGQPVIEFGLRRAQGIDGGISASRAAFIGGCEATSNTMAGSMYGIPVRGTHAHSWTLSFATEIEAFEAYAEALPHHCVFLVDTYDTLSGVRNAITAGRHLKERGGRLIGIRLDSGDLAYLSREARRMLDAAGFTDTVIIASNELDETIIESLKLQGAQAGVWGVGTSLATGKGQGALGGVYKLSALRDKTGRWERKLKLSEQLVKVNNPGILGVRRFYDSDGIAIADAIYDLEDHGPAPWQLVDPITDMHRKTIDRADTDEDLLKAVLRNGETVSAPPELAEIRNVCRAQRLRFHPGIRRFVNPHIYPVGLETRLYERKMQLMALERRRAGRQ